MQRRELITLRSGDWMAASGDPDSIIGAVKRGHQTFASLH
jgi:hypothetical protein